MLPKFVFAKRLTVDTFDDLFDYLQQFEKLVNVSRAKKLEKSHDPLALIAYTGSSSRNTSSYYVTHPMSVVDYEDEYQQDDVHTNSGKNKAIIQGDRVNIQSMNSGNAGRNNRRSYVQEEIVEGSNAPNETENGHYARNYPKPRVRDSKYFMEQMLLAKQDEAGVILTDEQNDFLFADASRMEEIEEFSTNICLMARIQPADNTSDAGPSYDSAFISEVQSSSNTENEEQMYPTHTKIINNTIGDDQIDSDIIFDSPNRNVNSGSIEKYYTCNSEISLNIRDTEDTLDDASKSQLQYQLKPIVNELQFYFEFFKTLFQRDIKEMKDVFESTESELCELEKQNDFLKYQLLEVSLKHEVELSVLLNHECVDNSLHAEIKQLKKKSIEIQEGLQE
ncbi:hypothetical protein Tco_0724248 [Tanacetum coccineum]